MTANPGGGDYRPDLIEQGRRLASERDDLIASGVNPSLLAVPLCPASVAQDATDATETPARTPGGSGTAEARTEAHDFDEDVFDASMCICGLPALGHPDDPDPEVDVSGTEGAEVSESVASGHSLPLGTAEARTDAQGEREARYAEAVVDALVPWLRHIFGAVEDAGQRKVAMEVIDSIAPLVENGEIAHVIAVADAELAKRESATGPGMTNLEAELVALRAAALDLVVLVEDMYEDCTPGRGCTGCEARLKTAAVRAALDGA